jgi:uncharacterized membrane protein
MNAGKTLIIVGIIFILLGITFSFFKAYTGWFGNLFGDISYKTKNIHFYMPLTTMIIISVFLTIILNIISKIFNK